MYELCLPCKTIALIDLEDVELVSTYKNWYSTGDNKKYVMGWSPTIKGVRHRIYLHRLVLKAPKGTIVDHINMNTLDCRKENLRLCTKSLNNSHNKRAEKEHLRGKYKGVREKGTRFIARISVNKKEIYLGCFKTAIEAAIIYNTAAIKYFGEFASLNSVKVKI